MVKNKDKDKKPLSEQFANEFSAPFPGPEPVGTYPFHPWVDQEDLYEGNPEDKDRVPLYSDVPLTAEQGGTPPGSGIPQGGPGAPGMPQGPDTDLTPTVSFPDLPSVPSIPEGKEDITIQTSVSVMVDTMASVMSSVTNSLTANLSSEIPDNIVEKLAPILNPGKHPGSPYTNKILSDGSSPEFEYYKIIEIDLAVARDQEPLFTGPRSFISPLTVEDDVEIAIGSEYADYINPALYATIATTPFDHIYITNPASSKPSGAKATFLVGVSDVIEVQPSTVGAKTTEPDGTKIYPGANPLEYIGSDTTDQDLTVAALDHTTSFNANHAVSSIKLHADTPISETVSVYWVSRDHANYSTLLDSVTLTAAQDYVLMLNGGNDFLMRIGDEIRVTCTNGGGAGTVFLTVTVALKE